MRSLFEAQLTLESWWVAWVGEDYAIYLFFQGDDKTRIDLGSEISEITAMGHTCLCLSFT